MLRVAELQAGYGNLKVVKGISMEVPRGEIVAIIGPNGAGKSTTLNCVAGLLSPKGGQVELDGEAVAGLPATDIAARGMVLCPEGRQIFATLTVAENLKLGAYCRWNRREFTQQLAEIAALFPRLRERLGQMGGTLSGGEQQMLAIARALMSRPKVLLLDEPSMGLAPLVVEAIFETISELQRRGVTILLVEQNARMALSVARQAFVMEMGQVVLQGAGRELLQHPQVAESYLGI